MKKRLLAIAIALTPTLVAQNVGTFTGPSVLTEGANTVGQRSGQDVELRPYAYVNSIRDNGLVPFAIGADGTLIKPGALNGIEVGIGGYGRHAFRRSILGLDYQGNFRHYTSMSRFDGSNQSLNLGYTVQQSRRIIHDFRGTAGTQTYGTAYTNDPTSIVNSNSLIFDNRTTFAQGAMDTTFLVSNSTAVSVGGNGYTVRRKAGQLTSVNGYTLHGTIRRQLGRRTSIGATYQHLHYDFAKAFGEADINMYAGLFRRQFGRSWTLDLMAGIFASQVQGVQSSAVDPVIAALLGVSSVRTIFYKENMLPTATVNLTRAFRRSSLTFNYGRSISPGNGLYLTSRIESYGGTYSYTSRDRWSLSMSVSKGSTDALAQTLQRYRQLIGSANLAYRLGHGLSLNAMYANRRQDIQGNIFQQDSSRISVGIYFRPGDIPISFH